MSFYAAMFFALSSAFGVLSFVHGQETIRKTGDSKTGERREVAGGIVRDAPLDLCIDKKASNAVRCLKKFGYLGEDAQDASGGDAASENRKGLLDHPGRRIQKPRFATQSVGGRFGSPGKTGAQGAESSSIELKGTVHSYREGQGPHMGGKDKAPPPNPR